MIKNRLSYCRGVLRFLNKVIMWYNYLKGFMPDEKHSIFKKLELFYTVDCCWPYSAAFFITLIIFYINLIYSNKTLLWPSITAYTVLFAYYLYNLFLFLKTPSVFKYPKIFIEVLTAKIIIWGIILFLLSAVF